MAIYLTQHGKCLSKEQDPEKGLSQDGLAETERIARVAAEYQLNVNTIIHSGKKRARQTADIFVKYLKPVGGIEKGDGLKPLDDVKAWALKLEPEADLMLVGHLPFMERLTGLLTTGNADLAPYKFQNSGIVCLDRQAESDRWAISWSLSPQIK